MTKFGIDFELLEEVQGVPPICKKVTGSLIWDINMDFTQKAIWVLDGHKNTNPFGSTYDGVVSMESVRIAFTYAALNRI